MLKIGTPTWTSLVLVRVLPAPARAEEEKGHIPVGYIVQELPMETYDLMSMNCRAWHKTPEATAREAMTRDVGMISPMSRVTHRIADEYPHHLFVSEITEDDWAWGKRPADSRAKYLNVDNFYKSVLVGTFSQASFERLVEAALILPLGRDKIAPAAA